MLAVDTESGPVTGWPPTVTVLTVALALFGLPGFGLVLDATGVDPHPAAPIAVQWTLAAVVLGVAVAVERESLSDVGFRRPALVDAGYVVVCSVAILFVFVATDPLVERLGLPVREGATAMGADVGVALALAGAVTTGVVEEILYRGYPIERLLDYTGRPLVAGGVAWAAFTLAHAATWPVGNLLQIALVAAVLTAVYLRRRTLAPVVGAHVLVWVVAALGQAYG